MSLRSTGNRIMKNLKHINPLILTLTLLFSCEDQFQETIKLQEHQQLQKEPYNYELDSSPEINTNSDD